MQFWFSWQAAHGERFQCLVDAGHAALVDVEADESQLARRRPADAVKEHERIRHEVIAALVDWARRKFCRSRLWFS